MRNDTEKSTDALWKKNERDNKGCPLFGKCGSCRYLDLTYPQQLAKKQKLIRRLMEKHCEVNPILGMEDPWYYRHKVQAVFGMDRKKNPISGVYEEKSHRLLPVENCLIEDRKADEIIGTIRGMLRSFKIRVYDENTGYGLLRYVMIRKGYSTGEIMVVLVTASPIFPSRKNFVSALLKAHPEITTVVQNVNDRTDSMVLGERFQTLHGKGYIMDELCGCRFKISPASFYQVNPVQAARLYEKAVELAGLTGREIAGNPAVLMTAYAVRGLDINTSYTIYNLLTEQKMKGVAVLYVGEDLDVLIELADRILVLCGGQVAGCVDARSVTKEEIGLMMTQFNAKGAE